MAALFVALECCQRYGAVMALKLLVWTAIISICAPATAQSVKEPLALKPSSPWQVDYADDRCRLARQFGEGDGQVLALFDRYGPNEFFQLTLAGKPVKTATEKGDATVQFGPAEEDQRLSFLGGNLGKLPALVFTGGARIAPVTPAEGSALEKATYENWPDIAPISEARLKAVRFLKISRPLRRPVALETGPMRAPLAALDKCIDNLLTHWGIDVEKHKMLMREAKPAESPDHWVVSGDYPRAMLNAGQPAIVNFRLSVGVDGVPTACHIQSTTRPKDFDNAVCKSVMRRARFEPALDAEGKPLASYYRNTVRFQIP